MLRNITRVLFAVVAVLLITLSVIAGKDIRQVSTRQEGQNSVELIFVKDGCSGYRFYDNRKARYFVKCENSAAAVRWTERPAGVRGVHRDIEHSIHTEVVDDDR